MGSTGGQEKSRYEILWDATKLTSFGALISTPEDEFMSCFPQFSRREQEKLYHIYTRGVAKLQEDVMLEFKAQCEDWEVKEATEELEELIEQHEQDGGLSYRSASLADDLHELTIKIKQEEVDKLRLLVPKEEETTAQLRLQREALRAKGSQEPMALAAMLAKVRKEREELFMISEPHNP